MYYVPWSAQHCVVFVQLVQVVVEFGDATKVLGFDGRALAYRSRRPALSGPVQNYAVLAQGRPSASVALVRRDADQVDDQQGQKNADEASSSW